MMRWHRRVLYDDRKLPQSSMVPTYNRLISSTSTSMGRQRLLSSDATTSAELHNTCGHIHCQWRSRPGVPKCATLLQRCRQSSPMVIDVGDHLVHNHSSSDWPLAAQLSHGSRQVTDLPRDLCCWTRMTKRERTTWGRASSLKPPKHLVIKIGRTLAHKFVTEVCSAGNDVVAQVSLPMRDVFESDDER